MIPISQYLSCLSLVLASLCCNNHAFAPNSNSVVTSINNNHYYQVVNTVSRDKVKTFSTNFDTRGMWNNGNAFGKGQFKFYRSQQDWMKPFPEEDKETYPELFTLPKGVYEISMLKPLGIVFEEVEIGKGVYVTDLVEGGNAERQGIVEKGDILIGVTAIKVVGAKWERRLIPAKELSFDTVVGAISSNEIKWGCEDVVLQFERPSAVEDEEAIKNHLAFYNPPGDSAWRTN